MDVQTKVAEIRQLVESARAMPMSSSCVVNRAEMLAAIDELAAILGTAFGDADRVIADREHEVAQGRAQAEQIVADARSQQEILVSDTEVYRLARREAESMLTEARTESDALRRDTDDYVDERLGNFEFTLNKTLDAVTRGRERLRGRSELDTFGREGETHLPLPDPHAG
ncbi:MAG: hypothetical protein ACRDP1_07060 [Nocardioidaceae bacterium]